MKQVIGIIFSLSAFSLFADDSITAEQNFYENSIKQQLSSGSAPRKAINDYIASQDQEYTDATTKLYIEETKIKLDYEYKKSQTEEKYSGNEFIEEFKKSNKCDYERALEEVKEKQEALDKSKREADYRAFLISFAAVTVAGNVKKEVKEEIDFDSWRWYGHRSYLIDTSFEQVDAAVLQEALDEALAKSCELNDLHEQEKTKAFIRALSEVIRRHEQLQAPLNGPIHHLPYSWQRRLGAI
jgi:hypothetical protein